MNRVQTHKNGFSLRSVICPKCHSRIIHPKDEQEYKEFIQLKNKQFHVKMRFVGNSYAVSIPKEIVNFMKEQEKIMNNMVRLSFEEFGRVSLNFAPERVDNSNNPNNPEKDRNLVSKDKFKKENKYH